MSDTTYLLSSPEESLVPRRDGPCLWVSCCSLLSGYVLLYSPLAARALFWEEYFSLLTHSGFRASFTHWVFFTTYVLWLPTPQFFALYCSLISGIDWLSHVYLKGSLTVQGLNIPPFLLSVPFIPSSEPVLSGGEGWCSRIRQTWILILADVWSWANHLILQTTESSFLKWGLKIAPVSESSWEVDSCTCLAPGSE